VYTEQVAAFFNELAPDWDTSHTHDTKIIENILDYADIRRNMSVLDVGCGTGILFPFYLDRNVRAVTGVDLSSGMIDRAKEKFQDPRVRLIVGDAEKLQLGTFDRCVVYSALPHFENAVRLISKLAQALNQDGRLTVAHSESREKIDQRHRGSAHNVSVGLMPASELASLISPYFQVDTVIDNDEMYVISGVKY
jgi:demethylmenaquinone methyltransferase/2-methoxy-6-polyprenyl-1,4-benzoquinol methylase